MILLLIISVAYSIDTQKYWEEQIKQNYPQIHYSATKVGQVSKPSISQYQIFQQRMRMLEESSKKEIQELKKRKKEIRRRILQARKNYNSWVIEQQQKMLMAYKQGKEKIYKQDEEIRKSKLKEMNNQFKLWKKQFEEKKIEFEKRFEREVESIKKEKNERAKIISQIMVEREQLNDLLKKQETHYY
ncbi:hypothetical protein KM1_107100 [Entamoeba histolytica HM-3:IMSS]|uniref:Meiosis-specific nuclear structural protein n=4 Tax=Entamoeba TaxID=5758 RepID=M2S0M5_ENTHI|nr:hypothetical protein ENU1_169370 [Entamoeba nuttalli P19]EKE38352.1 hypothetical protein ENU1_169370 [Entamoeba nuttalli P19]EMD44816.1 Hypothetical protein EHI5A_085220 [Entamoeba histolytica KU27]EMS16369.1 hypothetical protein KM1_107100 [Entamoeba histolytica HM-3:IMSS]|eukprot:XP_008859318.1 hypothetical protein ENU1_169370 [Entamoeba nuttalli P19]